MKRDSIRHLVDYLDQWAIDAFEQQQAHAARAIETLAPQCPDTEPLFKDCEPVQTDGEAPLTARTVMEMWNAGGEERVEAERYLERQRRAQYLNQQQDLHDWLFKD